MKRVFKKMTRETSIDLFVFVELCLMGFSLFFHSRNMNLYAVINFLAFCIIAIFVLCIFIISLTRKYRDLNKKDS